MLSRRRFLFLCAATPPALWIGGHGLLAMPGRMILELAGACSFCGKRRREVFALAGVFGRPHRICTECLELCLAILRDGMQRWPGGEPVAAPETVANDLGELLQWLRDGRGEHDELIPRLRRHLDGAERPHPLDFSCSFCDTPRRDCASLIAGPKVFVCDACTVEGIATLTRQGWRPS